MEVFKIGAPRNLEQATGVWLRGPTVPSRKPRHDSSAGGLEADRLGSAVHAFCHGCFRFFVLLFAWCQYEGLACSGVCGLPRGLTLGQVSAHQEAKPRSDLEIVLEKLEAFERSFYGYSVSATLSNENHEVTGRQRVELSGDGEIRRIWTEISRPSGLRFEMVRVVDGHNRWVFRGNRNNLSDTSQTVLLMLHDVTDQDIENAFGTTQTAFGVVDGRRLSEFVRQSTTDIERIGRNALVKCRHPRNGFLTIRFDDDFRISELRLERAPGDFYLDDAPPVEKSFRQVIDHFQYRDSGPVWQITNFEATTFVEGRGTGCESIELAATPRRGEVSTRLSFREFKIDDGTAVDVRNREGIDTARYEYRRGEVVRVLDGDALDAAQHARRAFGARWPLWYVAWGLLGLVLLVVLVTRRMRR